MKANLSLSVNIKLSFTEREIEVLDDALKFYQENQFNEFGYYSIFEPNKEFDCGLGYLENELLKALAQRYESYKQTTFLENNLAEKTKELV